MTEVIGCIGILLISMQTFSIWACGVVNAMR
jgi:hypothetical protein